MAPLGSGGRAVRDTTGNAGHHDRELTRALGKQQSHSHKITPGHFSPQVYLGGCEIPGLSLFRSTYPNTCFKMFEKG